MNSDRFWDLSFLVGMALVVGLLVLFLVGMFISAVTGGA